MSRRILFSQEQEQELKRRYEEGETSTQLAAAFAVSHRTVLRALHRLGAEVRAPGARTGDLAPKWRGGRFVTERGYVHVWVPPGERTYSHCYVLEHRLVMEKHLGRTLRKGETIHHKNGNRSDNRIENLELWVGSHPRGASQAHCSTCSCFEG